MNLVKHLRQITGGVVAPIETATVTAVSGSTAKVRRVGQTNSTKSLPVASGVTVVIGDVVQLVRFNGSINTALITGVVR